MYVYVQRNSALIVADQVVMELAEDDRTHTATKLVIYPDDARVFVKILKICVYL